MASNTFCLGLSINKYKLEIDWPSHVLIHKIEEIEVNQQPAQASNSSSMCSNMNCFALFNGARWRGKSTALVHNDLRLGPTTHPWRFPPPPFLWPNRGSKHEKYIWFMMNAFETHRTKDQNWWVLHNYATKYVRPCLEGHILCGIEASTQRVYVESAEKPV